MSRLAIIKPLPIASVVASRGSGVANLGTRDPKEVWADTGPGTATLTVDLGAPASIDTVLLGSLTQAATAATWRITGGLAAANEILIQDTSALRVPDVTADAATLSHALWTGAAVQVRYFAITITQPADAAALTAGVLVAGRAFVAQLGQEWGAGRQPIDTGSATSLLGGGFAIVEGARKRLFSWTFGDLSPDEVDRLELIALALGETAPGLVIEDSDRTPGLRSRIHYGLFRRWQRFERRNRRQTRWEITIEEWA